MASLKSEKPVGTQPPAGQVKKEPAKATTTAPKAPAPASKPAPKKAEPKPQPKKRSAGGKSAAAKN